MIVPFLLFAISTSTFGDCPPGYDLINGKCYDFYPEEVPTSLGEGRNWDRGDMTFCQPNGTRGVTVRSQEELVALYNKMKLYAPNIGQYIVFFPPTVALGARTQYTLYSSIHSSSSANYCPGHPFTPSVPYFPNDLQRDVSCRGIAAYNGVPCMWSESCSTRFHTTICEAPGNYTPPVPSTTEGLATPPPTTTMTGPSGSDYPCDPNARPSGTICVCNTGYIDYRDTNLPDKDQYKPGQKCIDSKPCRNVQSLSIIFLMDASASISPQAWPSLVSFVQSAADLLPNTVRTGFIKFATNTTPVVWAESGWSVSRFVAAVPNTWEKNGLTNTPAALEGALNAFRMDTMADQAVIVITDGLPYTEEYKTKAEMMQYTQNLANRITNGGRRLVALGFGPFLQQVSSNDGTTGARNIKNWLKSDSDYLEYRRTADFLDKDIMAALLNIACRTI